MTEYRIVYITPIRKHGAYADSEDSQLWECSVTDVVGEKAGKQLDGVYCYPWRIFKKYFHGTLTMFCKNNVEIEDVQEIRDKLDIQFASVTAVDFQTMDMWASNGVKYNLIENYFCKHNPATSKRLINAIKALSTESVYIQLAVERKTGKMIDITVIPNPEPSLPYAYKYRITKGFLPPTVDQIQQVGKKAVGSTKTDEKLSQDDIDQIVADLYAKGVRL